MSVSCPAGGQNCGQSGGRKIFFFPFIFGEKIGGWAGRKKGKKKFPVGLDMTTRPLHWKHNFFMDSLRCLFVGASRAPSFRNVGALI